MLEVYRKILGFLTARQKKIFKLLVGVMVLAAFSEILGLAAFMALLGVLSKPGSISENEWLSATYDLLKFESIFTFQLTLSMAVAILIMLGLAIKAGSHLLVSRFSAECGHSLSYRMLRAYLRQPYSWYLNRNTADIGRQVLTECQQLVQQVIRPSFNILASLMLALSIVIFLLTVHPTITLMSLAILGGGYTWIYLFARKRLKYLGGELIAANKERFRITQEATAGLKEVKLEGLEDVYADEFHAPSSRQALVKFKIQMFNEIPRYALEALTFAVLLSMVFFLLVQNDGGLLDSIPTLGIFAFSVMRILQPLQQVYFGLASLRSGRAIIDQIHSEFIEIDAGCTERRRIGRKDQLGLRKVLAFKNVSYTYPAAKSAALNDISIDIAAANIIGIVGATGAGKTTFIDLLLGLLTPDRGQILVDGTEIKPSNLRAWQNTVGYVPQHIFLTDDTVTANIAFGVPSREVNFAAVEAAARAAALHGFIMNELPDKYETPVGERGVRLSGGQRQRIGIARALYGEPSLLILDEATSALDNITERAVIEAIQRLRGQNTIIMIAHRLSTVENCDSIILMEGGKLSAIGTYAELKRENSTFQKMLGTSTEK